MKKGFSVIAILIIILAAALAGGGAYYAGTQKQSKTIPRPTPERENLVGSDKDEHGCIGAAGYRWCELKQKCLRTWEESCAEVTPAPAVKINAVPTVIVDETKILKTFVKNTLVAKHGSGANELTISVAKIQGDFASGGASGEGGGGMWFAAKVDGNWQLVWDGNGVILCKDLTAYPNFPASMIPECYNDQTNKNVKR